MHPITGLEFEKNSLKRILAFSCRFCWFAKFKRELIELSANFVVGEYSTTWLNNSYAACCCSSTPSINWTPVISFTSSSAKRHPPFLNFTNQLDKFSLVAVYMH